MLDSLMDDSVEGYLADWMTRKSTLGGGCLFQLPGINWTSCYGSAGLSRLSYMVGTRGAGLHRQGEDTAACIIKFQNGPSVSRATPGLRQRSEFGTP